MHTEKMGQRLEGRGHKPRDSGAPRSWKRQEGSSPALPRRELALLTPSFQTSGLQSPRECIAALPPSSQQVATAAPAPRFRDHSQMLVSPLALTGSWRERPDFVPREASSKFTRAVCVAHLPVLCGPRGSRAGPRRPKRRRERCPRCAPDPALVPIRPLWRGTFRGVLDGGTGTPGPAPPTWGSGVQSLKQSGSIIPCRTYRGSVRPHKSSPRHPRLPLLATALITGPGAISFILWTRTWRLAGSWPLQGDRLPGPHAGFFLSTHVCRLQFSGKTPPLPHHQSPGLHRSQPAPLLPRGGTFSPLCPPRSSHPHPASHRATPLAVTVQVPGKGESEK